MPTACDAGNCCGHHRRSNRIAAAPVSTSPVPSQGGPVTGTERLKVSRERLITRSDDGDIEAQRTGRRL